MLAGHACSETCSAESLIISSSFSPAGFAGHPWHFLTGSCSSSVSASYSVLPLGVCVSAPLPSSCRTAVHLLWCDFILTNYICNSFVSKEGHLHQYWKVRTSVHLFGGHNSTHNSFLQGKELNPLQKKKPFCSSSRTYVQIYLIFLNLKKT